MTNRSVRIAAVLSTLVFFAVGCMAVRRPVLLGLQREGACRTAVSATGSPAAQTIRWTAPVIAADRTALDDWCRAVGPAVIAAAAEEQDGDGSAPVSELVVVSWNVHVGAGDVVELVEQVRAGRWTHGRPAERFILLLQETYRSGALVPRSDAGSRWAGAIRPRSAERRIDVVELAARLGLSVVYVPSMRNGPADETDEDRGNAILSTEPLLDLEAIELPYERQRRVAVQATVVLETADGEPVTLRLTNAHLENLGPRRRLGMFSTMSRLEQAEALLDRVPAQGAAVLGGDLNTWFGTLEPAYRRLAARFDRTMQVDGRPTFGRVLRLDHLLVRFPSEWQARTVRLDRFGSDHHPLLAHLRLVRAGRTSQLAR